MPEDNSAIQRRLATEIVAAYVGRNQIAADQLPSLISTVHQALGRFGEPIAETERTPAISARRSVHQDHVICMDFGWKGQMLSRHLMTAHGLGVPEYRARWNLAADHPMTAPSYSERRSMVARELGIGRGGRRASRETAAKPETEAATTPQPKRRGRPRSAVASM